MAILGFESNLKRNVLAKYGHLLKYILDFWSDFINFFVDRFFLSRSLKSDLDEFNTWTNLVRIIIFVEFNIINGPEVFTNCKEICG